MQSYGGSASRGADTDTSSYQQQQWNMAYQQQWQQQAVDPKTGAADPNNAAAWAAYYQYYGQTAQPGSTTPNGTSTAGGTTPTSATQQPVINPQTGQPDYSQAWVEYYRSLGMHAEAEAILRQTQTGTNGTNGSTTPTTGQTPSATSQSAQQTQHNGSAQSYAANQQAWAGYSGYGGYGN